MAPLLPRALASPLAHLRMPNNPGVLAVEENVVDILIGEVCPLQDGLEVVCREALVFCQVAGAVVEAGRAGFVCQAGGGEGEDCEEERGGFHVGGSGDGVEEVQV